MSVLFNKLKEVIIKWLFSLIILELKSMEQTRVAKYKTYRDSFIKSNSTTFDTKKSNAFINTTSNLPYEDVIVEMNNQNEQNKIKSKQKLNDGIKIALVGINLVAVIIGLVFLGILAFGGM